MTLHGSRLLASLDMCGCMRMQVCPDHIRGLIPDALVDKYSFWRTHDSKLYGYPRADGDSVIVVSMQHVCDDFQGAVYRLNKLTPSRPMTLLNLLLDRPETCQHGRDRRLLRHLTRLWVSLDNLSHVLIWSSSFAKVRKC